MWRLSGFGDEISPDLDEQCDLLSDLGMRFLEFRSAWNTNVVDLGDRRIDEAARAIRAHGLTVSCVGSPVGKIDIGLPLEPELDRLAIAIRAAETFDTRLIRMFSFFPPAGEDADAYRDEVVSRLTAFASLAADHDILLCLENETGTFGDIPRRIADIVNSVASPHLRVAIDPGNFVHVDVATVDEAYPPLRDFIEYIQVKDSLPSRVNVVAGQGAGQLPELVAALSRDAFDGFFSLEPHLAHSTGSGGFSGPDGFRSSWEAFTGILRSQGLRFE